MPEEHERQGSWLTCSCLPHKINGVDTDLMFAYETPKVVKIQDRSLGLIKLILMLLIVVYVFIFSIWFKGNHFKKTGIDGIARFQWQEPVQKCNPKDLGCNADFESANKLPYCSQYDGKAQEGPKLKCDFYDARELPISMPNGVLLPTRKDIFKQVRSESCPQGGSECDRKYEFVDAEGKPQTGTGAAVPVESRFVADADDFTLLIDHSFRTDNGMMECDDHFMQGYWDKCDEFGENCVHKPIFCAHADCDDVGVEKCGTRFNDILDQAIERLTADPKADKKRALLQERNRTLLQERKRMRASRRGSRTVQLRTDLDQLSDHEEAALQRRGEHDPDKDLAISIGLGDVFSLRTLLAMAGRTLDTPIPDDTTSMPATIRSRGTAIVVEITYYNWKKWTLWKTADPPWYTIKVTGRPVEEFKQQAVAFETRVSRELHINYGVNIILIQNGHLFFPNLLNLIITFAAGMVMLGVSNAVTDQMMLRLLPRSDQYKELKYQVSEDMGGTASEPTSPENKTKPAATSAAA